MENKYLTALYGKLIYTVYIYVCVCVIGKIDGSELSSISSGWVHKCANEVCQQNLQKNVGRKLKKNLASRPGGQEDLDHKAKRLLGHKSSRALGHVAK